MQKMSSRTFMALGVVALGGTLLLSACTSAAPTPTPKAPTANNAVVTITMDEWHMKPSLTTVPAGKVSIIDIDTGTLDHEAVLLKSTKAANSLVVKSETGKVDESAAGENVGELEVEAGATAATTFELAPGHYVVICNVKDHYKNGMYFDLTVS